MARSKYDDDHGSPITGRGRNDRDVHNGRDRSSDEIVRDLEATRRDIGRTLSELEQRLTPGELFDQAYHYFRRTGAPEFAQNLGRGVRDNPMPVALTAISLGWLMWSSSHPHRQDGRSHATTGTESMSRARETFGAAADTGRRALERASQARASASETGAALAERARRAGGGVSEGARRARSQAQRALHEQPMTLGLAAFALASLAAALLPPTEVEDEAMGTSRDRAMKAAAEGAIERGSEGARRAADVFEEKASQAADTLREKAGRGTTRSY